MSEQDQEQVNEFESDEDTHVEGESKEDRFVRLAVKRARATIHRIHLMGNLSNTANYSYTDEQVNHIFTTLRSELDEAEKRFKKHTADSPLFTL